MTRIKSVPRHVIGWIHGVLEAAEPDASQPPGGAPQGTVEECLNLIATQAGRLAVRNGSRVAQTFTTDGSTACTRMLGVWPYSQIGAIAIGWGDVTAVKKNLLYRLTQDLAFTTGVESTSRHDLTWNVDTSAPSRPVVAELFEKLYIADAALDFTKRNGLASVASDGTVTITSYDLDGVAGAPATGPLKAYCVAAYNGVLFAAGYDSETATEEKAILRHSLLGTDPSTSAGWDKDGYAFIGAKGQRITALAAGRTILLVAKRNELYRISGTGAGLPGWRYQIAAVENTQGFGCSNPYALAFAEGYWYGVGEAGPFRTNGIEIESLVGFRRASWRKVTNLNKAWIAYHPERRTVKFAFNMTPVDSGRSVTYPYAIWNWDIERECWTGDEKYAADILHAAAIPSITDNATGGSSGSSGSGPTGAPSGLTITHASATLSSVAPSWTNGDAGAQTEVWVRTDAGGYALYQTAGPGATSVTISGRTAQTKYWVKVRHLKSGIYSDYTAEVAAYTKITAPTMDDLINNILVGTIFVKTTQQAGGSDLLIERDAVLAQTYSAQASGQVTWTDSGRTSGISYCYQSRSYLAAWPGVIQYSDYSTQLCAAAP